MTVPTLRRATSEDLRFVHSSWHTSYWKTWANKRMSRSVYNEGQDIRINRLLEDCVTIVAYFWEAPTEVLGWACSYDTTVHYVYVRGVYRRNGIGKGLVPDGAKYYSHQTDAVGGLFVKNLGLEFNPYSMESR